MYPSPTIVLFWRSCNGGSEGLGIWHARRGGKLHTGLGWGSLKEKDHLEDSDLHTRIILKWIVKKEDVRAWTGLMRLRIRKIGEPK